jgi:hypothetical protein
MDDRACKQDDETGRLVVRLRVTEGKLKRYLVLSPPALLVCIDVVGAIPVEWNR